MTSPLRVSVCMATYNGAPWVAEQLASIIDQLQPGDDIVIIDDCSTDTTLAEIDRAAANLNELRPGSVSVQRNDTNQGHVTTFERALAAATNDILVLTDQDDVWLPGYLDRVRGIFEAQSEVGLVVARPIFCDVNLEPIPAANARYRHPAGGGIAGVTAFILNRSMPRGCTMSLRRSELAYMLPFPDDLLAHDHWIFSTAALRNRMYSLHEDAIHYRRHADVLSQRRPVRQIIGSRARFVWQLARHLSSRKGEDGEQLQSPQ